MKVTDKRKHMLSFLIVFYQKHLVFVYFKLFFLIYLIYKIWWWYGNKRKKLLKVSKLNRVQILLIGLSLVLVGGVILIPNAFASPVPVKGVTITSERRDYNKNEAGF